MGHYLIHHNNLFLEWSTGVDAPVTTGMSLSELETYTREEYGRRGLEGLPRRIERALALGCSAVDISLSAQDATSINHAGYEGRELTWDQIVQIYFVEKREPVEGEGVWPVYEDEDA